MIRGYLILLVIVVMYKNRRKKDFFNVSLFSDGKLQQGKMMTQLKMKKKKCLYSGFLTIQTQKLCWLNFRIQGPK